MKRGPGSLKGPWLEHGRAAAQTGPVSEIELRWFGDDGVRRRGLAEVPDLHRRTDGFCWLDIPAWSPGAERLDRRRATGRDLRRDPAGDHAQQVEDRAPVDETARLVMRDGSPLSEVGSMIVSVYCAARRTWTR